MVMKNILAATDFSNDAYCALFYATKLLGARSCTFHILHVYDELTPLHGKEVKLFGTKKRLKEVAVESGEKLTATFHKIKLDNNNPLHNFTTISEKGGLSKVMERIIQDRKIDMVVMGNKGNTGAKELFMGGNTVQAVNKLTGCPVLAVPREIDYTPPREVAFITDFRKGCAKQAIAPLLFLASLTDASIRILHINEKERLTPLQLSNKKLLEISLKGVDHSFHWIPWVAQKAKSIHEFLQNQDIDMFAMVHQKRGFIEKILKEPVIKDISIYSNLPFLILPLAD